MITVEQAYQHGYQDGYHLRTIPHKCKTDPDPEIRAAYSKGMWAGYDQSTLEYLEEQDDLF